MQQEATQLGCPFHTTRLMLKGRSEDEARQARYAYFRSLCQNRFQALILAHQADDLAETVLKRILEGAHLPRLGAMRAVSALEEMVIWRPFLHLPKTEILSFLAERSLNALQDPSNADPAYLRARMRQELFPFLNQTFGKKVVPNLALLSERSQELGDYLDRRIAHVKVAHTEEGLVVDLTGLEKVEQRHLLQKLARQTQVPLNRNRLDTLLSWVEQGKKHRELLLNGKKIWVDGRKVIFLNTSQSSGCV